MLPFDYRSGWAMANHDRIQGMQQQFSELRQAIATDIADRFEAGERRLREGLSQDIDTKLDALDRRLSECLSSEMATRFEASERRLTESLTQVVVRQIETAQQHLEGRLQLHAEDLKDLVTRAAEGYGGTLEQIERDLSELNQKIDSGFSDHGRILADHNRRLVRLERARRRSQAG